MHDEGRRQAAAGRRTHHIGAVAHHFLGDEAGPRADGPRPRSVVVASADPLAMSAFAAAAAARTGAIADGRRWRLLEEQHAHWTAGSYLGDDDRVVLVPAEDFNRTAAPVHGLCWHLGAVGGDRLDAWGAVQGLPGCALPTAGTRVHLIWCLPVEQSSALAPLGLLARAAALLEPVATCLLAAPRAWPHRGRDAAEGEDRAADEGRLARRAQDVVGGAVTLGLIRPGMGTAAAAGLVTGFLHEAAVARG